MTRGTSRRWGNSSAAVLLKVAVSAGVISVLLHRVDVGAVWDRLVATDARWLTAGLALFALQPWIAARRWQVTLRVVGVVLRPGDVFRMSYAGLFLTQVLPGSLAGDASRAVLARRSGIDLGEAARSVVLERIGTVLALVLMVTILEPLLAASIGRSPALMVFPLLSVAGIAGTGILLTLDGWLPVRWPGAAGLRALAADARRLFLARRHLLPLLGWGMAGHANLSALTWALGMALGIQVSLYECMVLVPPVLLAMTMPFSIAGWGIREGAMVSVLGLIGIAPQAALALSLLYGATCLVASLPGGAGLLLPHRP